VKFLLAPALAAALLVAGRVDARAQRVEVTPFAGYRAGSGFFVLPTGRPVDQDIAPSFGVLLDVLFGSRTEGVMVEGVFSREQIQFDIRTSPLDPPAVVSAQVDHLQVGGIHELEDGRVRPFLSGLLGFSRYAAPGDSEVRFSLGGGGGVKLFATNHLGLRLDGRVYMTFVDLGASGVCGGNGCLIHFSASPIWQADFTAGLIVGF
jgi:hypothetical protein